MICVENADCTQGVVYFNKGEATNMEMLCSAPQGAEKHLGWNEQMARWELQWRLADVEVYRASQRDVVDRAVPSDRRTIREWMAP